MASSKKKKRSADAALVPAKRKQEVLGLVLMALALLLSLALVTYDPADNRIAQDFSLEMALNPGESESHNALGHVGAALAYLLVPNFLGYATLLLTGILGVWGYVVLRHRTPVFLPLITTLTAAGAFVLACLIGWFGHVLNLDLLLWAGEIGLGVAGWMRQLFGTVGSLILLLLMSTITVLLLVDHDIQRTIDRLIAFGASLREQLQQFVDRFRSWRQEVREERIRRQKAKAEALEQSVETSEKSAPEPASPPPSLPDAPDKKNEIPADAPDPMPGSGDGAPESQRVNDLFREENTPPPSPPPASSSEPRPEEQPPAAGRRSSDDVTLQVQQQIQEETAEDIDREAEVPDEELGYEAPSIDLLDASQADDQTIDYDELEENKQILLDKLSTYNIEIQDIKAVVGPTVTRYELLPAPGIKVSKIKSLEDDLAMAMAAQSIRVIAPIPGKSAVGVEIPNRQRELVRLRSVIGTAKFRDAEMELPVPIGKTIEGEVYIQDLAKMPHLLIAGATGSGKSVGLNALITGLIYACHPANLKFVIIDPKKIELQQYAQLEDHFLAFPEDADDKIITDFEQALGVFKSCEKEMEERYDLLASAGVRGIKDYNRKLREGRLPSGEGHGHMPYIVVVVDELADLMMTAGKEIEGPIARLAQMARAVGIHLVLATQRPSVDVITGLIKANFPARIAYQVASRVDSRTILDQIGAEGLVGNGDLLYMSGSSITRLQGPFVSIDEVDRINGFVADQPARKPYYLPSLEDSGHGPTSMLGVEDTDELFEEAARIIVQHQQGSVSLLQRKLAVGYTRAARIVDQLEEAGIVGPFCGTKARDVLVEDIDQLEDLFNDEAETS